MTPGEVAAVLVTRGDVQLEPILETLPYGEVFVWGPERDGPEAYGMYVRWLAVGEVRAQVVYVQDDDCVFTAHEELLAEYRPGTIVSTYGHGDNPDGLEDFVLMHGGALMDAELARRALIRYDRSGYRRDEAFYRYCDLVVGGLTPFEHVDLPFYIDYEVASRPNRMAHQPGMRDLKHEVAERVRAIRRMSSWRSPKRARD